MATRLETFVVGLQHQIVMGISLMAVMLTGVGDGLSLIMDAMAIREKILVNILIVLAVQPARAAVVNPIPQPAQ